VKPLKNAYLDRFLQRSRDHAKMVVHRKGDSMRWLVRILRDGHVYGTPMDQDQGSSEFAPFFGRPAATVPGPARVALRLGAALVPVTSYRLPTRDRYRMVAGPAIEVDPDADDVTSVLTRCNQALERAILAHPAQWLWAMHRWRTRPDAGPR
jgi:KDO2-lipid IV(A) lauroyltransferase